MYRPKICEKCGLTITFVNSSAQKYHPSCSYQVKLITNNKYQKANPDKIKINKDNWVKRNPELRKKIARDWARKNRKENPEECLAKARKYRETRRESENNNSKKYYKNNPEKVKARMKKHKEEYPEKIKARTAALKIKITEGTLCEICEEAPAKERHHDDYSRKYRVLLLCRSCHGLQHRKTEVKDVQ